MKLKIQQLELDVNSAGLAKPFCKESYPPPRYIQLAKDLEYTHCFWVRCSSKERFASIL